MISNLPRSTSICDEVSLILEDSVLEASIQAIPDYWDKKNSFNWEEAVLLFDQMG